MKRKIISFLLIFVIMLSSFSIFIFADEEEASSYDLLEEMETNFSDFDEGIYTSDTPTLIGLVESGNASETDVECVYLYMYIPGYTSGTVSLDFEWYGNGEYLDDAIWGSGKKYVSLHSSTEDLRFHKFKLWVTDGFITQTTMRDYWIRKLSVSGYGILDITYYFSVTVNVDGTYNVLFDNSEDVTLNVQSTTYRTNSTNEKYMYDQVASVYFSIPEGYQDYYDYLYGLTSIFRKYKIPFLLAAMKDSPEEIKEFLIQYEKSQPNDFKYLYTSENGSIYSTGYDGHGIVNFLSDYYYGYLKGYDFSEGYNTVMSVAPPDNATYKDFFEFAYRDYDASSFYDAVVDSEQVAKDLVDANLSSFDNELVYVTHTVEDSWDSFSYSYDSGFWDYWKDFGVADAFAYLFMKNSPEKLAKFLEERGIEADGFNFENEPYILKVDQDVYNDFDLLNKVDFCDKYAIGYNDYSEFKQYCNQNKNVVLYRFAVDDYLSMPISIYDSTSRLENNVKYYNSLEECDGYAGIVEEFIYKDFNIIEITMNKNGEFDTLMVSQDYIDIIGDVEGIEPEPDVPNWSQITGGVVEYVKSNVGEFVNSLVKPIINNPLFNVLRIALIALAVLALVFIFVLMFKLVRAVLRKNKKE